MKKALAVLALAVSPMAIAQSLEPGEWEIRSTLSVEGMGKQQPQTVRRCVTRQEGGDPQKWMEQQLNQAECQVRMKEKTQSSVRWEVSCPKQNMTGAGFAQIGRGTMETEQTMRGTMQGRPFEMQLKMSGRRLGACG